MPHELELAYVVLEVPDPSTLDELFGSVVGLQRGAPTTGGSLTWRNDSRVHRVVVATGEASDATVVAFEAGDDAAFEAVVERLTAAGHDVEPGSATDLAERRVERLVRTTAPWGMQVEVVTGLAHAAEPFASAAMPGGFATDGVGFGHVVVATTEFDAATRFAIDGLGMRRSDSLLMEVMPGIDLEVWFLHCNARHHSLALARAPFELPQRLHHIMFETNDRDDVGAAFDRAWATELPIPNGLGRHDNDGMFSFYVQGPAGFQVEVGHGARVVTDDWDDDRTYDRISAWGHQPLRQP